MFWATRRLHALIELASVSSCHYLAIGAGDLMKLDCAGDSIALIGLQRKCKSSACIDHVPALSFVHTARHYYRLNGL